MVPFAVAWVGLSIVLGRMQATRAGRAPGGTGQAAASTLPDVSAR
jgi:hypothetical protein